MSRNTYSRPSDVSSEEGRVLLDGPDNVSIALTPEAALDLADRLTEHAAIAAGKAREAGLDHRPK
jgi:hypothetical protein